MNRLIFQSKRIFKRLSLICIGWVVCCGVFMLAFWQQAAAQQAVPNLTQPGIPLNIQLLPTHAGAAESPENTRPLKPEIETLENPLAPVAPDAPEQASIQQASAEQVSSFLLKTLSVQGVTVLSTDLLQQHLSHWVGKTITANDLQQIADEVSQLYAQQGYVTSKVYVPSQQVTDGHVILQAVEGHVADIQITGNRFVRPKTIRQKIMIQPAQVFQLRLLEENLITLNQDPAFKQVKARLKPGSQLGQSMLELLVDERSPLSLQIGFDNQGRENIGFYRGAITAGLNNLLGVGDSLLATTNLSTDARTVSAFGQYTIPLNSWGLKLGANYGYSRVNIGGQLDDFDVVGTSYRTGVFSELPLLKNMTFKNTQWNLSADAGLDFLDSRVFIRGVSLQRFTKDPYPSLRPWHVGLGLAEQDKTGRLFLHAGLENGIDWLGGNTKYAKLNADLSRLQSLGKGIVWIVRAQGQWSPQNLPSLTQYQLGGINTVRGFREGVLIGDSGYLVSSELRFPLPLTPSGWSGRHQLQWQGVLYADHGGVFLTGQDRDTEAKDTPGYLTGYGVGLRGQWGKYLTARIDFGFIGSPQRRQPDARLHFSLSSQLL